jgi:acetyl esterase/lipase
MLARMRIRAPRSLAAALGAAALVSSAAAFAQSSADWAATVWNRYQVAPNVVYLTASNHESKLDIYHRRGATTPQPTVVYFHGGFWAAGAKEGSLMSLVPWLEMGWNVVNVEYRLARVAPAPAAVEDALCALRFLAVQAKTYNIDLERLVVTGESAGGHLTLASAMTPESAGLDRQCAGNTPVPKVAAAINWYGITDVADVIDGPHKANLAVTWLGSLPNRDEIAKRVSPLTYVRTGLPPILTIHGDQDPLVPYDHALRLHAALMKAGVPNRLLTIANGAHGNFTPDERVKIFATVRDFLGSHGLPAANP